MPVVPTLELMAGVYAASRDGGAESPRFRAYVAAARHGRPIAGYNPMTGKDVASTIAGLLAAGAEAAVDEVAGDDLHLFLTVATPGMWTDRIATEVHHRLGPPTGQVLLWTGEDTSVEAVRREAVAQAVRLRHGSARTVADAAAREGLAYARAGLPGSRHPLVEEALEVVGEDEGVGTMAALLYGDEVAVALGWTPLGLPWLAGYEHAVAAALAADSDGDVSPPAG